MIRSQWTSKLGFVLSAAGAAIGLGSVWKFPYVTAQNGGGSFLLAFMLISITVGLALQLAEMAIGRRSRSGAVTAFRQLGHHRLYGLIGILGVLCAVLVMSFYSVVGGWTLGSLFQIQLSGLQSEPGIIGKSFDNFIGHPFFPIITHFVFLALTSWVVAHGIQKGIERLNRILMPLLFILMMILIVRSLSLPHASLGIAKFLTPDLAQLANGSMWLDALGLSFFSLAIGAGCMVAYGSYLPSQTDLRSSAFWVTFLTLGISILSGLVLFPAMASFGFSDNTQAVGPGLAFVIMPAIFARFPFGGQLFAVLFFSLLFFAAITSAVSLLEIVTIFLEDEFKLSRKAAAGTAFGIIFPLGILASLSFGIMKGHVVLNRNAFEWMDFLSSKILLPLGGISIALFAGIKAWSVVQDELGGQHHSSIFSLLMRFMCCVGVPLSIGLVLIQGLR